MVEVGDVVGIGIVVILDASPLCPGAPHRDAGAVDVFDDVILNQHVVKVGGGAADGAGGHHQNALAAETGHLGVDVVDVAVLHVNVMTGAVVVPTNQHAVAVAILRGFAEFAVAVRLQNVLENLLEIGVVVGDAKAIHFPVILVVK